MAMAVDGRHREFLTLALVMPAIALMTATADGRNARERAWLAIVIAVAAPFGVDAWVNREAICWMLCCFALAWPERGHTAWELGRVFGGRAGDRPAAEHE